MDEEHSSQLEFETLVRTTCQKVLREYPSWVDDAVQSTYEKYFGAKKEGTEIKNPAGWLVQVARTTSIDIIRTMSPLSLSGNGDLENHFSDNGHFVSSIDKKIEIKIAAHLLISFLPKDEKGKRQRKIIEQAVEGKSRQEIARILAVTEQVLSKDVKELRQTVLKTEACYQELVSHLSERQKEILQYAKKGKRGEEIARTLGISPSAVSQEKKSISEILKKLFEGPWDDGGGGAGGGLFGGRSSGSATRKGAGTSSTTRNVFRAFLEHPLFYDPPPHGVSIRVKAFFKIRFSLLGDLRRIPLFLLALARRYLFALLSPQDGEDALVVDDRTRLSVREFEKVYRFTHHGLIDSFTHDVNVHCLLSPDFRTTTPRKTRYMELIVNNLRATMERCLGEVTSCIRSLEQVRLFLSAHSHVYLGGEILAWMNGRVIEEEAESDGYQYDRFAQSILIISDLHISESGTNDLPQAQRFKMFVRPVTDNPAWKEQENQVIEVSELTRFRQRTPVEEPLDIAMYGSNPRADKGELLEGRREEDTPPRAHPQRQQPPRLSLAIARNEGTGWKPKQQEQSENLQRGRNGLAAKMTLTLRTAASPQRWGSAKSEKTRCGRSRCAGALTTAAHKIWEVAACSYFSQFAPQWIRAAIGMSEVHAQKNLAFISVHAEAVEVSHVFRALRSSQLLGRAYRWTPEPQTVRVYFLRCFEKLEKVFGAFEPALSIASAGAIWIDGHFTNETVHLSLLGVQRDNAEEKWQPLGYQDLLRLQQEMIQSSLASPAWGDGLAQESFALGLDVPWGNQKTQNSVASFLTISRPFVCSFSIPKGNLLERERLITEKSRVSRSLEERGGY